MLQGMIMYYSKGPNPIEFCVSFIPVSTYHQTPLFMALWHHDPFLLPYDGDCIGTHGDPRDFHAAMDSADPG